MTCTLRLTARASGRTITQPFAEVLRFEDGRLIASHPLLEGRNQRRTDPSHRKPVPVRQADPVDQGVGRRPLAFYDAVGRRLAGGGAAS